jgi:fatty-acyl-CoA synthase
VRNAADYVELVCRMHAQRSAIEFVGREWSRTRPITYDQLNTLANRLASYWISVGLTEALPPSTVAAASPTCTLPPTHRVVSVLIENSPSFLLVWLSLAKIGITAALLNTSLKGRNMAHSIDIAHSDTIIVSTRYIDEWNTTKCMYEAEGKPAPRAFFTRGADIDFESILYPDAASNRDASPPAAASSPAASATSPPLIEASFTSAAHIADSARDYSSYRSLIHMESALFLIYTSGTTGPSKAAIFSHRRFLGAGVTWAHPMELTHADKYLITLPLYHGNGGVVAVSACMHVGCTMVIREKFSTSSFWSDVRLHGVTAMVYVGELWRYLHNAPRTALDAENPLRVIAGNGLRGDIWNDILSRFGINKVVEHYGMTEMPAGPYLNFYGRIGACGFIPPEIRAIQGADKLVRYDADAGYVTRDSNGRCEEVIDESEVGEALFLLAPGLTGIRGENPHTENGAINASTILLDTRGNPLYKPYRNYTEIGACERRVYRDVFEATDAWFATGDILRRDINGFVYFVDRMGDSYRWKGENVATSEVAEALCSHTSIEEANVYGVEWKGEEGRVGMASIVWKDASAESTVSATSDPDGFDGVALLRFLLPLLPAFALPAFLRIRALNAENTKTSTMKFQKSAYQAEGYDLARVGEDRLYYWPGARLPKRELQRMMEEGTEAEKQQQAYVRITQAVYDSIQGAR